MVAMPDRRHHHVASLPGTSMPATFAAFGVVRAVSPRSSKGSSFSEGLQGGGDVLALDAGQVGGRSISEVVVHHLAIPRKPWPRTFLKGGACTSSTSSQSCRGRGLACLRKSGQLDAGVLLKMRWRYSRRPVSCVVVVAIIKVSALAIWGSEGRTKL